MLQNKSFKLRIYPNKEQRAIIDSNIGAARFVYNHFLNAKICIYKENKSSLSYNKCATQLTILKKQDGFEWLQGCDATSLQQSLRNLDAGFNNFFKGLKKKKKVGFPKFKSKRKAKLSYRVVMNISIKNNGSHIKLPKVGLLKAKHSFDLSSITKIFNATVSKSRSGKYFVSLCCLAEVKTKPCTGNQVGVDLGIKEFATLSDGGVFSNPKFYRKYEAKLAKAQRKFSKMVKGSNNREKQRVKLAKLYEKATNCRVDFIHKATHFLTTNYDKIVIEDLNVSGMLKNHKLAKSIADASFAEFRRQLEYKCAWYGKEVVVIDRWFPSSKTCSACGNVKQELTLKDREYCCEKCGLEIDRDLNAAINILTVGTTGIA